MCVGYVSILMASAVCVPPSPPGPMPSLLILSSISRSSSLTYLTGDSSSTFLVSAFFARSAHFSNVPPIPTHTTIGGHALGPASFTAVNIAFFTPSMPSAGFNINILLIFSLPKPFGATVISTLSPGTIL